MRLVFDARLMANQHSGLGRYTGSLLCALLNTKTCSSSEVFVLLHRENEWANNFFYHIVKRFSQNGYCTIEYVDSPPISLKQHLILYKKVNSLKPDLYFYPHFDLPLGISAKKVFVVHDVIPLVVSAYVQRFAFAKKIYFKKMLKHSIASADRCIAVSKTTRRDLLKIFGNRFAHKIEVVYEGPILPRLGESDSERECVMRHSPFLLYVGDRRPHKNIKRMLDIFVTLRDVFNYGGFLILVGPTKNYGFDVERYISNRKDILILGNVSDQELNYLYRNTSALIFISEYEGFGLPVIEAARFDRKMILSDGGALSEIAPPNACILERKLSVYDAAMKAAEYLFSNITIDNTEFNKRFSWENTSRTIFPEMYQ